MKWYEECKQNDLSRNICKCILSGKVYSLIVVVVDAMYPSLWIGKGTKKGNGESILNGII